MNFDPDRDLELVQGLWVPASDAKRLAALPLFEGLPNLDVKKVSAAIGACARRRTALDVGAHIGATALFLARHFAEVIAFEAVPQTYAALSRNVAGHHIRAIPCAVSNAPGEIRFEHNPKHTQLSHALLPGRERMWEGSVITDPIQTRTIDSFGVDMDEVDFIKVDVEGFELQAMEGACATILRCLPVILIEQRGNEDLYHGGKVHEASLFLESLGMVEVTGMPFHKDRVYHFPA